jgi:outer membrane biosynthesis protein TonB
MKRPRLNLDGLDLGGLKAPKKPHTYTTHCLFWPKRKPVAEEPAPKPKKPKPRPKPKPKPPSRPKPAPKPKPKPEYVPTLEEIEAAKQALRRGKRK